MAALDNREFKNLLEDQKESIVKQIEALTRDQQRKKGPLSADSQEQSLEIENDEVVDSLLEHDRVKLRLIETALGRIERGKFGRCISCGEQISSSRLKAVPYVGQCMSCQLI